MKFLISILFILLLLGCSVKETVKTEIIEVPVVTPGIDQDVTLIDTVIVNDSLLYGEMIDSLNQVIGNLKVYYQNKLAKINIKPRTDTVKVEIVDTLIIPGETNVITTISGFLSWWEEALLILIAVLLLAWKGKRSFKFFP